MCERRRSGPTNCAASPEWPSNGAAGAQAPATARPVLGGNSAAGPGWPREPVPEYRADLDQPPNALATYPKVRASGQRPGTTPSAAQQALQAGLIRRSDTGEAQLNRSGFRIELERTDFLGTTA